MDLTKMLKYQTMHDIIQVILIKNYSLDVKPVFIITIFLFSITLTSPVFGIVDSPRTQMLNGIASEDVICKTELQLMIRNNGDAICAQSSSIERWVDSGIAKIVSAPARDLEKDE